MASMPLILVILLNFVLSLYLLNRYGNLGKHNVWITTSVFVAWFFSFNVIFVLPLDVTSTIYNECISATNSTPTPSSTPNHNSNSSSFLWYNTTTISTFIIPFTTVAPISNETIADQCRKPWSYVPPNVLLTLWKFIYWSSQVLTWIFLPIFQSYSMSGEFTTFRKIKSSFIENIKYYCCFGVLFVIFLIYYASKEHVTFEGLKVFCTSASNTFGLFLLTVLMGYGLVEIPRTFLINSRRNHRYQLDYLYFKVAKLNGEKCEADGNLDDLLDDIRDLYIYATNCNHVFVGYLQTIIRKCPESFQQESFQRTVRQSSQDVEAKLNEKNLIKLNAKIKRAVQTSHRTKVQYTMLVQDAIELKELNERRTVRMSPIEIWLCDKVPQLEWLVQRKPTIYRVISLLVGYTLAIFSVMIIWSEFTFFIHSIPVSLFALTVKLLGYHYLWIEIFSMISIAYLCTCCYYTIFKIRIFNYYYLAKHHQTDEYSLIFCGMLLCRLAAPLCLNFLSLIHLDSHITKQSIAQETAFTKIMGHMDTITFISDHLFLYLPVLMSLFCVATFFKLGSKIVHYFGIEQFNIADEITQDLILQGENLVKRESQKLTRGSRDHHHQHHQYQQQQQQPTNQVAVPVRESRVTLNRHTSQEQLLGPSDQGGYADADDKTVYGVNKNLFDDI